MRRSFQLLTATLLLAIVAGCAARPDSGATAPAAPAVPAPRGATSSSTLVAALRAAGLDVKDAGTIEQPFFSGPVQVFTVDGSDLQLFSFAGSGDAQRFAAQVSPTGGSIGTASMAWMAPPHFFHKDALIAISIAGSPKVLSELQRLLGPQFAGRP